MKQITMFLVVGFFLIFWVQSNAQKPATVVRVVDGDTYQLLQNKCVLQFVWRMWMHLKQNKVLVKL
jgi:endonuclease YncB( thermonuclease family)